MAKASTKEKQSVEIESTATLEEKHKLFISIEKKNVFARLKDNFFEKVGLIGWEQNSTAMIVSLLTGGALCFLGEAGTGKTFGAKQIARYLLSYTISVVDSSKADWDELVGPYDPTAYNSGIVKYMNTPMSIWEKKFLILDELTRADTKIQNGFLELLRENLLNGMETDIEYKWAAANPLHHEGTQALSEALADRFMFVLQAPELLYLGHDKLKRVSQQGADVDDKIISRYVPGLKRFKDKYSNPELVIEFQHYLQEVGKYWLKIQNALDIEEYCIAFAITYQVSLSKSQKENANPFTIESRRMNGMISAITAYLAVELYEYETHIKSLTPAQKQKQEFTKQELDSWLHETTYKCIKQTINTGLSGKEVNFEALSSAHAIALTHIKSDKLSKIYQIRSENNNTRKFYRAICNIEHEPLEIYDALQRMEEYWILEESNWFGAVPDESLGQLSGFDMVIPLLFLIHHSSPIKQLFEKLPVDLQDKIKKICAFCYECKILTETEDLIPEMRQYFGRLKLSTLEEDEKSPSEKLFTKEHLELDIFERSIRETVFRRTIGHEGQFGLLALSFGEEEKYESQPDKIKEEIAKREIIWKENIMPDLSRTINKVHKEYESIREILIEEGYSNLVRE